MTIDNSNKQNKEYVLMGDSMFCMLEEKIQTDKNSFIKEAFVSRCSGTKEVVMKYIESNNIPLSSIQNKLRK